MVVFKIPVSELSKIDDQRSVSILHNGTSKGQIISKGFLMSAISSKKRKKEFDFTTMIPQVDLF